MSAPRKTAPSRPAGPKRVPPAMRVEAFLAELAHPEHAGITRLRALILGLDPRITEEVKWNAPSFKLEDHFATFKLHPPRGITLVLHTGAKLRNDPRPFTVEDPAGLLKWAAPDRAVLTLASSDAAVTHEAAIAALLRQWIAQLPAASPPVRPLFTLDGATPHDPTVAAWFSARPGALGELAAHWFARVRARGADVTELLHDDQPTACVAGAAFVYVATYRDHVNLGFFQGSTLPDPAGLLQGSGKFMRHVPLRPAEPVDTAALEALLDAAYADVKARLARG